jgi:hypothetical protein
MVAREPDFHPRYFVAVVPGLYLWAAVGAVALTDRAANRAADRAANRGANRATNGVASRALGAAAIAALVGVALPSLARLYTDPGAQKQDYRQFVATVEGAAGHEDTVLFLDGPSYGLTRRYEMDDSPVKIVNVQSSGNLERGADSLRAEIADLAREYPHLWLATDGEAVGDAGAWLDANAQPVESLPFQNITLRRYLVTP